MEYKYVIVNNYGIGIELAQNASASGGVYGGAFVNVPALLNDGWEPVRETGMGAYPGNPDPTQLGGYAYAIVLLQRAKKSTG
jgi:hypothetical protein